MPQPELTGLRLRDRQITLAALAGLFAIAAFYTVTGVGMEMSALEMTRAPWSGSDSAGSMMSGMLMAPPVWTWGHAIAIACMWWIMMIAMMVPSAAPVVLLYDALRARTGRSRGWPVAGFTGGYLAAWAAFSVAATALQWLLEREGLASASSMALDGRLLGAAVLIGAGIWQLTPAKQACLRFCRNPAQVLVGRLDGGAGRAFRTGFGHGLWCVGCCWGLMALLFFGGIMNLWWIMGLALIVLIEKLWARGEAFARAVGVVLIGAGLVLAAGAL